MTLRLRIGLIIAVVLGGLVVKLSVLAWQLSRQNAENLEAEETQNEVRRVLGLLNGSLSELGALTGRLAQNADARNAYNPLTNSIETSARRLELVLVTGANGQLRYGGHYRAASVATLSPHEQRALTPYSKVAADSRAVRTGFAFLPEGLALVAAAPLTGGGAVVTARYLRGVIRTYLTVLAPVVTVDA